MVNEKKTVNRVVGVAGMGHQVLDDQLMLRKMGVAGMELPPYVGVVPVAHQSVVERSPLVGVACWYEVGVAQKKQFAEAFVEHPGLGVPHEREERSPSEGVACCVVGVAKKQQLEVSNCSEMMGVAETEVVGVVGRAVVGEADKHLVHEI